jgi:hypothetical protein
VVFFKVREENTPDQDALHKEDGIKGTHIPGCETVKPSGLDIEVIEVIEGPPKAAILSSSLQEH